MRSIVTVTTASDETVLTTLERVKAELGITGTDAARDELLESKIDEASSDIQAALGFIVPLETVSQTFWQSGNLETPEALILDRTPVDEITSVTLDGVVISSSLYRFDPETGELFALDSSGYPSFWCFCKSAVIVYSGGYSLPIDEGEDATLPAGIQGACIDLMSSYWAARGRDPTVKAEDIPGVIRTEYWVGAVGEAGELPPSVVSKLSRWRRVPVA